MDAMAKNVPPEAPGKETEVRPIQAENQRLIGAIDKLEREANELADRIGWVLGGPHLQETRPPEEAPQGGSNLVAELHASANRVIAVTEQLQDLRIRSEV